MLRVLGNLSFSVSKVLVKSYHRSNYPQTHPHSARTFSVTINFNMKFIQFTYHNRPNDIRVGYLKGDKVVDINNADCFMPTTMLGILKAGVMDIVGKIPSRKPATVSLSKVKLVAPIHGVDKILCVALNYADHCKEANVQYPPIPVIFTKFASNIIGPNEPVRLRTELCKNVDWEVELAAVIGKEASSVHSNDAMKYVFGYTIAQDITCRDWQKEKNGGQFVLGKAQDTFCPIGPYIVTPDETGDPHNLELRCWVNGVVKQDSNTSNIIHTLPAVIERLSSVMTLLPGDLILTGTPGGVGQLRQPPEFLKPGDIVRSEIQNIGTFEVPVEKF